MRVLRGERCVAKTDFTPVFKRVKNEVVAVNRFAIRKVVADFSVFLPLIVEHSVATLLFHKLLRWERLRLVRVVMFFTPLKGVSKRHFPIS